MKSFVLMFLIVASTAFNALYMNKIQSDNNLKVMGTTGNVATWEAIYDSEIYKVMKTQETEGYVKYLNEVIAQAQSGSTK